MRSASLSGSNLPSTVMLRHLWSLFFEEFYQQRFLGVEPVLRFIPHEALWAIENIAGDLLAPVGGQAVKHPGIRGCMPEQIVVDREPVERSKPVLPLFFVTHRDPCVSDDYVCILYSLCR